MLQKWQEELLPKKRANSIVVTITKIYVIPQYAKLPPHKIGKPVAGVRWKEIKEAYENKRSIVLEYQVKDKAHFPIPNYKRQVIPYDAPPGKESVKDAFENPQDYVFPYREVETDWVGYQLIFNFLLEDGLM